MVPLKCYRGLYRTAWRRGFEAVRNEWVFYVFLGHPTERANQMGGTGRNVFYPPSAVGLVTLGYAEDTVPVAYP